MFKARTYIIVSITALLLAGLVLYARQSRQSLDNHILSYTADPQKQDIRTYWKDAGGERYGNFLGLKNALAARHQKLLFAMNGGMYRPDRSPLGLYIEKGKVIVPLDTASGSGNFYLRPNGVFYLTQDNKAGVCVTADFKQQMNVEYATQSGPMLVIDGQIHPAFRQGSANKQIRNGVGVLPDGRVIFAMSKEPVNFYDFATFFLNKGCRDAFYLDGFVSRIYYPAENWLQTDGDFGVIIGVTER